MIDYYLGAATSTAKENNQTLMVSIVKVAKLVCEEHKMKGPLFK